MRNIQRLKRNNRQRGVALVAVLLIFALISVLAAGMISRQRLQIHQSMNLLSQTQAYQLAQGVEVFARQLLVEDFEADKKEGVNTDTSEEPVFKRAIIYAEPTFSIEGQLDDLQGRFNLNSLVNAQTGQVNTASMQLFQNLLFQLGITDMRVEPIIEWMDPNEQVEHPGGVEDSNYLGKDVPYRTANGPFQSVSELLLIESVTQEAYELLEPYVTALPAQVNKININTAPAAILQSLDIQITPAQAQELLEVREKEEGFDRLQDFLSQPALPPGVQQHADLLDVRSEYFQLTARGIFDGRTSRLVSILYRGPQGGIQVIRRDQSLKYPINKPALELE